MNTIYKAAQKKKQTFNASEFGVIHFNGKIVSSTVMVAVVLLTPAVINHQLLGSPVIPNSTGAVQAAAINGILLMWGILACIVAMVFDTTASNTGNMKGAATLLE